MKRKLFTFIGFNACWLVCVIGAAQGVPWAGPIVVLVFCACVLSMSDEFTGDTVLLAGAAVFGYLADSVLVGLGAFTFPPTAAWGRPSAVWMVALWVNLAVCTPVIFGPLRGRYVIAALFGAVGGAVSYAAGMRLGAIVIEGQRFVGLAMIGVAWAVSMPALLWGVERTRGLTRALIDPASGSSPHETPAEERAA